MDSARETSTRAVAALVLVSLALAGAGGALFRVKSAVTGVDVYTLLFYLWDIGVENLGDYEVVRSVAEACVPYALAGGAAVGCLWFAYAARHTSVRLRVSLPKRLFRLPVLPRVSRCWIPLVLSLLIFSGGLYTVFKTLQLGEYLSLRSRSVPIYRQEYVDPGTQEFAFPEKRRNLIHIVMESMETTFADQANGGHWDDNHIPYLTRLARENISFPDMRQALGMGYTSAGLVAQSAGLPLSEVNNSGFDQGMANYAETVWNLHDILAQGGYRQMFLCGSDGVFGERTKYFTLHGVEVRDYYSAIQDGEIPAGYHSTWWGMEDTKLYEYAKDLITEMSAGEEPFAMTLLTVDTHAWTYYVCEDCPNVYPTDYENIYRCADRLLCGFMEWLQEQDFYEDTTVVITGDHLNMDGTYFGQQQVDGSRRRVYNCFINPAENLEQPEKARILTSFDIFPTTLRAMGVTWNGSRLALGTDLFSQEETLPEKLTMEVLNASIMTQQAGQLETAHGRR